MSNGPVGIVGSYISPYVRKGLVALHLKDAGAPISEETYGAPRPRRGVLRV